MTRPGFVLEVDDRTPALVVHEGEHYRLERFPRGTRVLYPPESLPGLPDPAGAVAVALAHPVAGDPLRSLLRPGMTLTVVVDDGSTPIAPIRGIDIRARAVEQVLAAAAAIGVDDVAIVSRERAQPAADVRGAQAVAGGSCLPVVRAHRRAELPRRGHRRPDADRRDR